MPRYDFACDCGEKVEKTFTFFEAQEVMCNCGKKMGKVFTATPAIFQGNGWGGKP